MLRCGNASNLNPGYFLPRYEVLYLICKPDFKLAPKANVLGDVWNIPRDTDIPHPHPFPVELPHRCIQCTTADTVLDPFIGSGSTAIAAENLKRSWVGIDISRKYCEMTGRRVEKSRMSVGDAKNPWKAFRRYEAEEPPSSQHAMMRG
jgi:DNA modification methylase